MNLKRLAIFSGYIFSMGIALILFFTFFIAYINNKFVTVYIDSYGEAHMEWFLICFIFDVMLVGLYLLWRDMKK